VPDAELDDLRVRLRRTRLPTILPSPAWEAGADLTYIRDLAVYWADEFDWRSAERGLNELPQFTASVDGQRVHFVHIRSSVRRPLPLLLVHGWPSSFVEMLKLATQLSRAAKFGSFDGFDLVIPSLPGFGFSDAPKSVSRATATAMGEVLFRLMTEALGYLRFGAYAEDVGAAVVLGLASSHPDTLVGVHLPGVVAFPPPGEPPSPEGEAFMNRRDRWSQDQGAYSAQQGTYPQTLAMGLSDSPVGLAAWILDKYRAWSDCDGQIERRFSKDELLTNITLYWITNTINTSFLFYYASRHQREVWPRGRLAVPLGITLFPRDNPVTGPREWAERAYDIRRWTTMPRGGHFAAMEEPELLADEIRAFFAEVLP
jgi:pimeloyl-ACP methyl ester carboxylesterase